MLTRFFFIFFICFCFSQKPIHNFGDKKIFDYDFYFENPKNAWGDLSDENKKKGFDVFIKKELVLYDFEKKGLHLNPSVFLKLKERERQLAVNFYYEQFVAGGNTKPSYLSLVEKNIKKELFIYHLLFGYKGCALPAVFEKTKETVLSDALVAREQIITLFDSKKNSDKGSIFKEKALALSQDPNVSQNKGLLGWVYWGRSVDEFQTPVFELEKGDLSTPILTRYGYHLVFVEKERPSNYSYYNPEVLKGQLFRFGLQSLSVDSLRFYSSSYDKNILKEGVFSLNTSFIKTFLSAYDSFLLEKKLRFSKNSLVDFLLEFDKKEVLFVFKNKGFGVGWFLDKLKKTPSTRVSPFKNVDEFSFFLSTFILQEEVFLLAKNKNVLSSAYFIQEFKKHKKNIYLNEYLKHKNSLIGKTDSSSVFTVYNKGIKDSLFFFPEKALVKEIKTFSKNLIDSIYVLYLQNKDFDSIYLKFGEKKGAEVLKSISKGSKGLLGEVVFSLQKKGVSSVVENVDKSFSLVQVVDFIPKKPKNLSVVYSQIEKRIIKNKKDSIKVSLLKSLKDSFGFSFNYKEL